MPWDLFEPGNQYIISLILGKFEYIRNVSDATSHRLSSYTHSNSSMYAARRNRIRLRTTLLVTIFALLVGAILTLSLMQQEIAQIREVFFNAPQTSEQKINWVDMLSALGEEVIQMFISVTSDTY